MMIERWTMKERNLNNQMYYNRRPQENNNITIHHTDEIIIVQTVVTNPNTEKDSKLSSIPFALCSADVYSPF